MSEDFDPTKKDLDAGFEVLDSFERFSQKNDIYSRAFWDPEVRSEKTDRFFETYRTPLKEWKSADGFRQRDYALRNASWHLPDIFAELKEDQNRREGFLDPFTVHRQGPEECVEVESPTEMSREIKHVAKVFGADLVGITAYDERWVYTHAYSRQGETEKEQELPTDLPNVIVIVQEMDRDLIETVPSALSGTATGVGYSQDSLVLLGLAQYVINLGYRAVATMNDTALAIPYALKAGLGEYGRHGLLITKEFGPRVRIGKIFTDLPLAHDYSKTFVSRNSVKSVAVVLMHVPSMRFRTASLQMSCTTSRIFVAFESGQLMRNHASSSGQIRIRIVRYVSGYVPTTGILGVSGRGCGYGLPVPRYVELHSGWLTSSRPLIE